MSRMSEYDIEDIKLDNELRSSLSYFLIDDIVKIIRKLAEPPAGIHGKSKKENLLFSRGYKRIIIELNEPEKTRPEGAFRYLGIPYLMYQYYKSNTSHYGQENEKVIIKSNIRRDKAWCEVYEISTGEERTEVTDDHPSYFIEEEFKIQHDGECGDSNILRYFFGKRKDFIYNY